MKTKILILLFAFASCKKDLPEPMETEPENLMSVQATPATFHLDFQTAGVNITNLPATSVQTLDNNGDVGKMITFTQDNFIVCFCRLYSGEVIQITGSINSHPFVVINGAMNICHGNQQQSFTYKLY